jgi:hypothetical protein
VRDESAWLTATEVDGQIERGDFQPAVVMKHHFPQ